MPLPVNFTERALAASVFYKFMWTDEWTAAQYLLADYAEFACAPEIDEAQLTWYYGKILYPNTAAFTVVAPLDLVGAFIKIEAEIPDLTGASQTEVWIGRVQEPIDLPGGILADVEGTPAMGVQRLVAWGLGHDLDNVPVISTVMSNDDTSSGESPGTTLIHRAVGFNMGKGAVARDSGEVISPNRTTNPTSAGCFAFREDLNGAQAWGLTDAAQYLLDYYTLTDGDPADEDTIAFYPWQMVNEISGLLAGITWKEHAEGRSTWELLGAMFSRKRALGFYVDPVGPIEDAPAATVVLFTLVSTTINLGDGNTLPANPNTLTLDFTADPWIESLEIRQTQQTHYDQIIARGEPKGSVFTVSGADGTIEADWSSSQQTEYNQAASTASGYAGLTEKEKMQRNDAFREQRSLERVYSWMRLPQDWDGMVNNGEGDGTNTYAFPTINQSTGEVVDATTTGDTFWLQGLRFQSHLPLYVDLDYSDYNIEEDSTINNLPAGSVPDFQPPLAAVKLLRADSSTFYAHIDKVTAEQSPDAGNSNYVRWNADISMQDQSPGFKIKIHAEGRGQQHRLFLEEFTKADATDGWDNLPDMSWRDNLLLTVYCHADSYAECRVPKDSALTSIEITRLVIDVPDAYMDWVAPGTVVGIKDGQLVRSESGGMVRNDFNRLQKVALLASGWFGVERSTAAIGYKRLAQIAKVGYLITTINGTAVNTVVTKVRYDFEAQKTTIQTQHGEMDFTTI